MNGVRFEARNAILSFVVAAVCSVAQADLPGLWQAGDVGVMSPPGSTTYDAATGGFTLTAAGGVLNNDTNPDAFQYLYQPVKGDFTVDLWITNNLTGRSALMIRNALDACCRTIALYRNADRNFGFYYRGNDSGTVKGSGGSYYSNGGQQHVIRLVRRGNRFTPYLRLLPDGAWFSPPWVNSFSNGVDVAMDETVYLGVAAISTVPGTPQSVRAANVSIFDRLTPSCTMQGEDLVTAWRAFSEAARYTLETRLSTNDVWRQVLDVSVPVPFRTKADGLTHLFKVTAWDAEGGALETGESSGTYDVRGLRGLYLDRQSSLPCLVRNDSTVDFSWGAAAPAPEVPYDLFKVLWVGDVVAPVTGTYSFYLTSYFGGRLYVGSTKVIDQWGAGNTTGSNTISLTQGQRYPIRVDYYENYQVNAACKMEWSVAGQIDRQAVPQNALRVFPWAWQRADMNAAVPGNTEYDVSNGVTRLTMRGSGSELGTVVADGMHFAWQTLYGDGEISARVVDLEGGSTWAKAALSVRENADAGARGVTLAQRPGDRRMAFIWRPTANVAGGSAGTAYPAPAYFQTNKWMRLVKKGATVSAYYRFTADEPWVQTDLPTKSYTLPDDLSPQAFCAGIGVCANNNSGLVVTGVLDHVVLRSGPAAPSAQRLSSGAVELMWLNVGQAASNVISRATEKSGTYAYLASVPFYATNYVDPSASGGLVYYKVTACYPDGIACDSACAATGGFYAEYYGGVKEYAHCVRRHTEPNINQNYTAGVIPLPGLLQDEYFVTWQTWFTPPASATYTFTANASERLRLWVDGRLVTNLWVSGNYAVAAPVVLTQGQPVALRFVYFKELGAGQARLRYYTDQDATPKFVDEQVSDPLLPMPAGSAWKTTDIGNVPYRGRVRVDATGTRFLVQGSGKSVGPAARPAEGDALSYVWQAANGWEEMSFRVSNYGFPMDCPATNAMAGVMYRESTNAVAGYVFAGVDGGGRILFYKNSAAGVESLSEIANPVFPAPRTARFRIMKRGNAVAAWYMTGADMEWQPLGSAALDARDALVGLAVSEKAIADRFVDAAFEDVMRKEIQGSLITLQ